MRPLLLILPWILLTSFFWSDEEEKQLHTLNQAAEASFRKDDYATAKERYEELLDRVHVHARGKYRLDWPAYVDIVLRYVQTCVALEELETADTTITHLLSQGPPRDQVLRIKIARARLISHEHSASAAYLDLLSLTHAFPKLEWRKEDRTFFEALTYSLQTHYDEMLHKARRFALTGFHAQASALYEELLAAIEQGFYPGADALIEKKVRYHLAQVYYVQAKVEQTLALCYNEKVEDKIDREMLYLAALCHKKKQNYQSALDLFHSYVDGKKLPPHYDQALFEIGLHYYKTKHYTLAQQTFERLQKMAGKPAKLASLYLARLHIELNEPEKVESVLAPLMEQLGGDPIRYECAFLRGQAAYAMQNYAEAKRYYEQAIPQNTAQWTLPALMHLGTCYVRMGEDPRKGDEVRRSLLLHGEKIFLQLLATESGVDAAHALGRLYLTYNALFGDEKALAKIEPLLAPLETHEALLLRAEASHFYATKEALLTEATQVHHKDEATYAYGWYLRGLNHFEEGLKQKTHATPYFELAASALGEAFRAEPNPEVLQLQAHAHAYAHSPLTALALIEQLSHTEETLYLKGILATHLLDLAYFPVAETALQMVAEQRGKFHDEALYALGTLYYSQGAFDLAKRTFIHLAHATPHGSFASEALFWAAEAAEELGDPEHTALRARVYQDYPHSERSAEAYFKQYPYEHYLGGDQTALAHLNTFPSRFPHSPYRVIAHYALSKHTPEFEHAREHLESAIKSHGDLFASFRYQAMLELAQLYLTHTTAQVGTDVALHLLTTLIHDYPTREHKRYPSLLIEAEYTLAKAYLDMGKTGQAQKCFAQMLTHFEEGGINKGYYLSCVWIEQGKLAQTIKDIETATRCFAIAEECGKGYLTSEQTLELWLVQSDLYTQAGEHATAMRLLSKVINAEGHHALRAQAMYKRAELYEQQGRPELAIRQLEAIAKKGGQWALHAEEKLREDYAL